MLKKMHVGQGRISALKVRTRLQQAGTIRRRLATDVRQEIRRVELNSNAKSQSGVKGGDRDTAENEWEVGPGGRCRLWERTCTTVRD